MVFNALKSIIFPKKAEELVLYRLRDKDEYLKFRSATGPEIDRQMAELEAAAPKGRAPFTVPGFSFTAGREVDFHVDYKHSGESGPINWREGMNCSITHFNNRMRACFHIFDLEMPLPEDAKVYVTEQVTPIFGYFKQKFPNAVGSEYMGSAIPLGSSNECGVRNEDLTALTFADGSFDAIVSLDVLEHIPDTMKALTECRRVLRKGGRALISAPFIAGNALNTLRAEIENGEIVHLLPPEYHGDPMSAEGILCFHHFGWEILQQLRAAGFRDAYAICYFSRKFGYVGGEQFIFVAVA